MLEITAFPKSIEPNIINIIGSNGNIQATYRYNAYGKIEYIDEESIIEGINSFFYKGYYYDEETQLYYCNSRYYDPNICRWISIDEISYLDSDDINGINLWCYCGNNPVMYSDENGNEFYHWAIGAGIVLLLGLLTIATAGGSGILALNAIMCATAGIASSSTALTISAFAFVGAATMFGTYALCAAGYLVGSTIYGNELSSTLNTISDAGKDAMSATIGGAITGAIGGFLSHSDQYPKINHSWSSEQKKYWGGKAPKGKDGFSIELHHPFGRKGKGFYIYYPIERTAHQRLTIEEAKIYGKGIHPYPPFFDYWSFFRRIIGGF